RSDRPVVVSHRTLPSMNSPTGTSYSPEERDARGRDLLDVPVIGAAATPHHVQPRQPALQLRVLPAQLDRIADVERRRLVQLRVALARGVRAQAPHPLRPGLPAVEHALEVSRVRAV